MYTISIHTAYASGDEDSARTRQTDGEGISIHTAYASGDEIAYSIGGINMIFQSTPHTQAVTATNCGYQFIANFNPHRIRKR